MESFINEEGFLSFDCEKYPFLFPVQGKPGQCTLFTPDFDNHFPHTNQTKHCWANYVEFHKCEILKGKDDVACRRFDQTYRSLCPTEWVETWEEQRASMIFPGQEIWVSAALQTDRVKQLLKESGGTQKHNVSKLIKNNEDLREAIKEIIQA